MVGTPKGTAVPRETTRPWDPIEYLENNDAAIDYLKAALEDGDSHVINAVFEDVDRYWNTTSDGAPTTRRGESGWTGGFTLPSTDLFVFVSGDLTSSSAIRASDYR